MRPPAAAEGVMVRFFFSVRGRKEIIDENIEVKIIG
jgi:hypothetical protein